MIYLIFSLIGLAGVSLYLNFRQSKTNGKLVIEIMGLKASLNAKDKQLVVYATARPGDAGRALGSGEF